MKFFTASAGFLAALLLVSLHCPPLHAQEDQPAPPVDPSPEEETVLLKISFNDKTRSVLLRLFGADAPQTVANFRKLVSEEYYDGIAFHRVIRDFLVQTGDPYSRDNSQKHLWGTGGPDYKVPPEIKLPHRRGSLGMARLGNTSNPDKSSSGSQFYILLADAPQLDGQYTVFGTVIEGMELLDEIGNAMVDSNDNPVNRIEIKSARLGGPGLLSAIPSIPNPMKVIKKPFSKEDDLASPPPPSKPGKPSSSSKSKSKPRKTDAEKGAFTRFIERVW